MLRTSGVISSNGIGSILGMCRNPHPSPTAVPRKTSLVGDVPTVTSPRAPRPIRSALDRPRCRRDGRRLRHRPRHRQRLRRLRCEGGDLGEEPRDVCRGGREEVGGLSIPTDVRESGEVDRALEQTVAELGPVSILVNNAGRCLLLAPARDVGERLGCALPGQSQARHPVHAAGGPGHGRARDRRQHHERDLHRGRPRRAGLCGLRRRQGRRDQLHQDRGARAGTPRHPGQRVGARTSP